MQLEDWQDLIGNWGDATFPQGTEESILRHLTHEVNEELHPGCDPYELADVAILLLQLAHKRGINLAFQIRMKHKSNKARKWRYDPEQGFTVHVD